MKFIIGLGNPGNQYANTRHNVGFMLIDEIVNRRRLNWQENKKGNYHFSQLKSENNESSQSNESGEEIILIKPQTFMNRSGDVIGVLKKRFPKFKVSNLFVVYDDLDIEFGNYKIQLGKSPKVHNGVISILNAVGKNDFWHVRIGVDNRQGIRTMPGSEYVLSAFRSEERQTLNTVFDEIIGELI